MREITLSAVGPTVPALGLGCMGLIAGYGPVEREESLDVLRTAAEMGVVHWDTADAYGLGAGEELVGAAVGEVGRDNVVLATKFGGVFDAETGAPTGVRGDAAYVHQACENSLSRLGVDHIDLYYQHLPDPDSAIEETAAAMAELVRQGKIGHLGLSNVTAEQLRRAHAVHPVSAVQVEWSLFSREVAEELVPACAELGVGVVAYSPLSRGFLTGNVISRDRLAADDVRHMFPRFSAENSAHNAALLHPVHEVADRCGATPSQVALAWVLDGARRHGVEVATIPGTKRAERLRENVEALAVHLDTEDLEALESIAAQVRGSRVADLPPELRRFMSAEA